MSCLKYSIYATFTIIIYSSYDVVSAHSQCRPNQTSSADLTKRSASAVQQTRAARAQRSRRRENGAARSRHASGRRWRRDATPRPKPSAKTDATYQGNRRPPRYPAISLLISNRARAQPLKIDHERILHATCPISPIRNATPPRSARARDRI